MRDVPGYPGVHPQTVRHLDLIANAARRGERCPKDRRMDSPGVLSSARVATLVRYGYLKLEIYGRWYRVAEILKGPNKGLRTAEYPVEGVKPWKVVPEPRVPTEAFHPVAQTIGADQ